ncbi:hypothetical protein CDD80_5622 [Ophiocordyceps camponoti-rufipedis]|uniref:RRM domain-containing protein n=1 Tax=Ophiocordyceps camponoti-rufipedis TaxID=2004952 RepID=A0A2C5YTL7_9HYPO|nr:hypothetical protein CDD80_5622 [Ophiocordyceps camponoti-rufipedis]
MSGNKLDKPLDEIVSAQRRTAVRRRNYPARRNAGRPAPAAPVGGVQKANRAGRGVAAGPVPAKGMVMTGESKVIVSNLPKDVSEHQIKEYFFQSVGPIKRVDISYGPDSISRGVANVTFAKPDGASNAFQKLNGLLVDNRPIKIEIVVGAAQADKVIPHVKTLAERTTHPKAHPKPATGKGNTSAKGNGANRAANNKKRRGKSARPTKKTTEELDSEMADYFVGSNETTTGTVAAAAPAANGDAAMEDEIMVGYYY